jgi:hypothetical protein
MGMLLNTTLLVTVSVFSLAQVRISSVPPCSFANTKSSQAQHYTQASAGESADISQVLDTGQCIDINVRQEGGGQLPGQCIEINPGQWATIGGADVPIITITASEQSGSIGDADRPTLTVTDVVTITTTDDTAPPATVAPPPQTVPSIISTTAATPGAVGAQNSSPAVSPAAASPISGEPTPDYGNARGCVN